MSIVYHGTRPDEKENLEGGIKLIPRPTDVSPVGPFFLTESRSAAIEWAKKISNGLFGGNNPGVLFTYELNVDSLSVYDFGEELSGESYVQWQKVRPVLVMLLISLHHILSVCQVQLVRS